MSEYEYVVSDGGVPDIYCIDTRGVAKCLTGYNTDPTRGDCLAQNVSSYLGTLAWETDSPASRQVFPHVLPIPAPR